LIRLDAAFRKTVGDRVMREAGVVLSASEAFLLSGRNDLSVVNQSGGAVMVESGDA